MVNDAFVSSMWQFFPSLWYLSHRSYSCSSVTSVNVLACTIRYAFPLKCSCNIPMGYRIFWCKYFVLVHHCYVHAYYRHRHKLPSNVYVTKYFYCSFADQNLIKYPFNTPKTQKPVFFTYGSVAADLRLFCNKEITFLHDLILWAPPMSCRPRYLGVVVHRTTLPLQMARPWPMP